MRKILAVLFACIVGIVAAIAAPGTHSEQEDIAMEMVVSPAEPLSKYWIFVVDGSNSMDGIFGKVRKAFLTATAGASDEWEFAAITFDDARMERFRDWVKATPDELVSLEQWIRFRERNRRPVLSYGATAIRMALAQNKRELTVILITDGGFTEVSRAGGNFQVMRDVFEAGQAHRANNGLPYALVCCIGIENKNYTAGRKPPDADCQAFLKEMGERWRGGYFLVRGAIK